MSFCLVEPKDMSCKEAFVHLTWPDYPEYCFTILNIDGRPYRSITMEALIFVATGAGPSKKT